MPLIKLRKASQDGQEVGVIYVNADQIVSVSSGEKTTEIHTVDGQTRWVKNPVEEVVKLAGG
jgi:hypothetical protein